MSTKCSFCAKPHDSHTCKSCKGCGKCGQVTNEHSARDCPQRTTYPPWHEQDCDGCFTSSPSRHEVSDCPNASVEKPCNPCGHAHRFKSKGVKCFLWEQGQETKITSMEEFDEITDQFTPKARETHRKKFRQTLEKDLAKRMASSPKALSLKQKSPPSSPSSKVPITSANSPSRSPKTASSNSPSAATALLQNISRENLSRRQRELLEKKPFWDKEEKEVPRGPPNKTADTSARLLGVKANFFNVKIDPTKPLYRYSIALDPINGSVPTQRDRKRSIINSILTDPASRPVHNKWASDYESIIISSTELYPKNDFIDKSISRSCVRVGRSGKLETIGCQIKQLENVKLQALQDHVTVSKKKFMDNNIDIEIKALNVISWKKINDHGFHGGRSGKKFYPETLVNRDVEASKKGHLYFIRQGFFSSIRPGQNALLLNVNPATSAFYRAMRLDQWMTLKWNRKPSSYEFKRLLRGVRVLCDVGDKANRLTRSLWDIGPDTIEFTRFVKGNSNEDIPSTANTRKSSPKMTKAQGKKVAKDEESETVLDYLKEKYKDHKEDIFSKGSFCINVGNDAHKIWYPADKLTILDWQIVTRLMDEEPYVSEMLAATKLPQETKNHITNHALPLLGVESGPSHYKDFHIVATSGFLKLNSKIVESPHLRFKDSKTLDATGNWNLTGKVFIGGAKSYRVLHVISLVPLEATLRKSLDELQASLRGYEVNVPDVVVKIITTEIHAPGDNNRTPAYRKNWQNALESGFSELERKLKSIDSNPLRGPILVVLPEKSIPMYSEIKMWGDCVKGIPTICITQKKLRNAATDAMLRANVCLKFNIKLRGVSHQVETRPPKVVPRKSTRVVEIEKGPIKTPRSTMIVGADVSHPGQGMDHCPSMAAVVATTDDTSAHYLGSARLQAGKQEYITDLKTMIKERVFAWYNRAIENKNGMNMVPRHILFYRDGVSESQYGMVRYEEMLQIRQGYEDAIQWLKQNKEYNPEARKDVILTLVVVTKRHHARFYPDNELSKNQAGDKAHDKNLQCGMVADTVVVTPDHFSFYLQSHDSPLGTAKNGHYVVIHDDFKYDSKLLQEVTNNICYTGMRATKALSVCTPARYADFLCDRLRCYMRPVLDGHCEVNLKAGHELADDEVNPGHTSYEGDQRIWRSNALSGRMNPWHKNMDDIMFYL